MAPSPLVVALAFLLVVDMVAADSIFDDIEILWGVEGTYFFMDGDEPALGMSMNKTQSSAYRSKQMYLFARIDVDIKLVEGDSAGTVCTIYVRSTPGSFPSIEVLVHVSVCTI